MIKFKRTRPRIWAGNGFGYEPAEYDILRNGERIDRIWFGSCWHMIVGREEQFHDKLADAKRAAVAFAS